MIDGVALVSHGDIAASIYISPFFLVCILHRLLS